MTNFDKKILILCSILINGFIGGTRDLDNGFFIISQPNSETGVLEHLLLRENSRLGLGPADLLKTESVKFVPIANTAREFQLIYQGINLNTTTNPPTRKAYEKKFVLEIAEKSLRFALKTDPSFMDKQSFLFFEQKDGSYVIGCEGLFLARSQAGECTFQPIALEAGTVQARFLFKINPASKVYAGLADAAFQKLEQTKAAFEEQLQASKEAKYNALLEAARQDVLVATDDEIAQKSQKIAELQKSNLALEEQVKRARADAQAMVDKANQLEMARQQEAAQIALASETLKSQFPDFDLAAMTMDQIKALPKYATLTDAQKRDLEEAKGKMTILSTSAVDMAKRYEADANTIAANAARNYSMMIETLKLEQKKALAILAAERALNETRLEMMAVQDERLESLKQGFVAQKQEIQAQIDILNKELDKVNTENTAMAAKLKELQDNQYKEQSEKNAAIASLAGIVYAKDLFTPGELVFKDGMDLPTLRTKMAEAASRGNSEAKAKLLEAYNKMSKSDLLKAGSDEIKRLQSSKLELVTNLEGQIQTLKQLDQTIVSNNEQIKAAQKALDNLKNAKDLAKQGILIDLVKALSGLDALPKNYTDLQDKYNTDLTALDKQLKDAKTSLENVSNEISRETNKEVLATKIASRDSINTNIQGLLKQKSDLITKFQNDSLTFIYNMANAMVQENDYTKLKANLDAEIATKTSSLATATGSQKDNITAQIEGLRVEIRKARNTFVASLGTTLSTLQSKLDTYFALIQKNVLDLSAQKTAVSDSFTKILNKFQADGQPEDQIVAMQAQMDEAIENIDQLLKSSTDELGQAASIKRNASKTLSDAQVALTRLNANEINDAILALQELKRNQSAEIVAQTEEQIKALQKTSSDQQAAVYAAHEERMKSIQADFDASVKAKQNAIANLQATTDAKIKEGRAQLDKMAEELRSLQGANAIEMSRKISALQAQTDALNLQLVQEKQNTVDAISKKLEEKKAMQEAQAKELGDRAAWIKAATDQNMKILIELAEAAQGAQKTALDAQLASTKAAAEAAVKAAQDATSTQIANLQKQIKEIEDTANAQQASLAKDIEDAQKQHTADKAKKEAELAKQLAEGRTAEAERTRQELAAADAAFSKNLADMQASLQAEVDKVLKAQQDFKDASDRQFAMLQQRLADVQGSANALSLTSEEHIGISKLGEDDNPTHLQYSNGQLSWNNATRFLNECVFKIYREKANSFSIRTADGANVLTIDKTNPELPSIKLVGLNNQAPDSNTQCFYFQKVESPILMTEIATFAKDGFLNFDEAGLKIGKTAEQFKINRFNSDKGTIEGLLFNSLKDSTIKGTKYGLDTADEYFVSTQAFNSQSKLKDFTYVLEEYILNRSANKLFNEAMAARLDLLRVKIEKFLALAQAGASQEIVDKAILESLKNKAHYLDPVEFNDGDIVFVKAGQEYLTTQLEAVGPGKGLLMAQRHVFDPTMAFKVSKPDPKVSAIAFVTLNGDLQLGTKANGELEIVSAKSVSNPNLFQYSGTRQATTLFQGDFVLARPKSNGKNYATLSPVKTDAYNFELEIYAPTSFEYFLCTKGLPSYSKDALSKKAISAIGTELRMRLKDSGTNSALKALIVQTFAKYLDHPVVNNDSKEDWSKEVGLTSELIIETMPKEIPVDIIDRLLTTVESVSISDGSYVLLTPNSEPTSFVKSEAGALIASPVLNEKALFKVVKIDQTAMALVNYQGKYLDITADSQYVSLAADTVLDGDTVVARPANSQILRVYGTGSSIFLKPENVSSSTDSSGFLAINKEDKLCWKDASGSLFDEADERAKFKVEVLGQNSPKIAVAKGNYNAVPSAFYSSMEQLQKSKMPEDQKSEAANTLIQDIYSAILKSVTLDNGTVDFIIKDEFKPLVSVVDDPDKNVLSMLSALDQVLKRIKYDAKLVKGGIKFSEVANKQLKDLVDEFKAAKTSEAEVSTAVEQTDPFMAVAKPNNTDKTVALFLDDLWTDKNSIEQGARIWHSYLTKLLAVVYGITFDDNSDLFGFDWQGRVLDGQEAFSLTKSEQEQTVSNLKLFKAVLKNSKGADFTKTYPLKIDSVIDENGREITPESIKQETLDLGLELLFDAQGAPKFALKDPDLKVTSTLALDKKKQLLDVVKKIVSSSAPILKNFDSKDKAKDFSPRALLNRVIKDLTANINFIETGIAGRIGDRVDQIIEQMAILNFQEKYIESERLAGLFKRAPKASAITPAIIAKALTLSYSAKTIVYLEFLSTPQANAFKVIRDNNKLGIAKQKAALAAKKRADAVAAVRAKALADAAARAATGRQQTTPAQKS